MWLLLFKILTFICVRNTFAFDEFLRAQSVLYGMTSLANDNNTICSAQLIQLHEGINLQHFWALKVLDASGQPRSGFLWGNNLWIGSHSQCMDISNTKPFEVNAKVKHPALTPYDFPPYSLQFVMAYMRHNSTQQLHAQMPIENMIQLGLCVPKSCSTLELQNLLEKYIKEGYMNFQNLYHLSIRIQELKSLDPESILFLPKTIILLVIGVVTLLLVAIGTYYDVRVTQPKIKLQRETKENTAKTIDGLKDETSRNDKAYTEEATNNGKLNNKETTNSIYRKFGEIVQCFSIYSNTKMLTKTVTAPDSIGAIHGIRLFSILWVICVHTVFFIIDYLENVPTGFRLSEPFMAQIFSNSTYCVDSFLFLSGFLLSYTFYKSKGGNIKSKNPINYSAKALELVSMFVHRYLRLTPVYAATILISDVWLTSYRQISPLYATEQPDVNCPKYWWRNLLYINNFYPRSEMCLSWSWYLSADTQFFFVASALLILSTMFFKAACFLLLFCIVTCVIVTGYSSYAVHYIPTMDEQFVALDAIYDFPWNRIGPYLVGVVTGYILVIKMKEKLILSKKSLTLCWIIFPAINLWILFALYGRQISVEFSAVYMGVSRTLWGFGLGWLFIACRTGHAGIINKFLSFRGWIPLSRLTYCCYLLNPLMINVIHLGAEASVVASQASFALAIFGVAFMTLIISFFYSLLFESPYIRLTKILFSKMSGREKQQNTPV